VAKRRKSIPKAKPEPKVEKVGEVPVASPIEPPPAPVEAKGLQPARACVRCSRVGEGLLCRRCSVVLHGNPDEVNLYRKPVNPTVGW